MAKLHDISGIDDASRELLEAAGYLSPAAVARAGVDELTGELERANAVLRIAPSAPAREQVGQWIREARDVAGALEEPHAARPAPVDYESKPEVAAKLADAPFAIPLPARVLVAHNLAVADVPPADLLSEYSGEFDVRTGKSLPGNRKPAKPAAAANAVVRVAEGGGGQRLEIDGTRLRSTEEAARQPSGIPVVKVSPASDRVALIRAPRSTTNEGRDPNSRFYIRGVLHSHPNSVIFGALVTMCVMVAIPLAIVSSLLLLLSGEMPQHFEWVPAWLIVFPLALPLFGAAYLIWGLGASCRICGQKLFRASSHFKHKRAHRLPLMGHIFPLCIHILMFRWFRCTHCGTPVRLKE